MKVKFVPQNVEFEIKPGESVLHVAQDHGLYIKSVCKGVPSCAECRVRVIEGDHNVMPPGSEELSLIGTGHFIDRRRLSCQLKCFGDITIDMNEQIAKENGIIVGRKKKLSAKDDRVEAVVRRGDSEAPAADEPADVTEPGSISPEQSPRPPREDRSAPETRGPGESGRNPRDRGPREARGGQQQARGGNDRGAQPSRGPNDRDRGSRDPNQPSRDAQSRPQQQGQPTQQPSRVEGQAPGSEAREGGARKRRRRRGKGGGGGQGPSPNAPSCPPTRPSAAQGPKPQNS